ncbi:YihY/virulence factor BrkB family protein [Rugosimonospora africana]|nr:YihY/virulence factor BrkB family protein [Rugosimonospora africana]
MDVVGRLLGPIDRAQQRWGWAGYPYAVIKKYQEDNGANLAALLTYYAFLSVFPLLLVFTSLLGYALRSNPGLQQELLHSALVEFPVVGQQLRSNGLRGHWYVLAFAVLLTLWGARGVAIAIQNAMNTVWNVPYAHRPNFVTASIRGIPLLFSVGAAVLITGLLSGIGSATSSIGLFLRSVAFVASAVINIGIFLLAFRLATVRVVPLRDFARSALISAVLWQVLLALGTLLVAHQVRHAQALYSTFGVVIGLLAWLHLQAQLTLLAVESDVVRVRGLWPRSVVPPPLTRADRECLRAYAWQARRRPKEEQDVSVRFSEPGRRDLPPMDPPT